MGTILLALLVQAAGDGLPAGTASAEGVACDLLRSFMSLDSKAYRAACLPGDAYGKKHAEFVDGICKLMDEDRKAEKKPDDVPRKIAKLFKARSRAKNGPASAAYALYNFQDLKFVDVQTELQNGKAFLGRILVVQREDKTWRVIPSPDLFALLGEGLNDETASTEEYPKK